MPSATAAMRAAVYRRYGGPLTVEEVARPVPRAGQVLVEVAAASVNSWDWDQLVGTPQGRLANLLRPANPILGADVAGRVVAVGEGVSGFAQGDELFGDISGCGWGGFAEYAAADADCLVAKPAGMSFEQAAAIPQAGLLALQALRKAQPGRGDKVLVIGAGGGMGTFAVQMARMAEADVTGVDRASKLELIRSLGAGRAIDFAETHPLRTGDRYDIMVDAVARYSPTDYLRALKPGGRLVVVGGRSMTLLQVAIGGGLISLVSDRRLGLLVWRTDTGDLEEMKRLFAAGSVVPVIERTYPLEETADAIAHLGEGRALGKIVVTMAGEGKGRA